MCPFKVQCADGQTKGESMEKELEWSLLASAAAKTCHGAAVLELSPNGPSICKLASMA